MHDIPTTDFNLSGQNLVHSKHMLGPIHIWQGHTSVKLQGDMYKLSYFYKDKMSICWRGTWSKEYENVFFLHVIIFSYAMGATSKR